MVIFLKRGDSSDFGYEKCFNFIFLSFKYIKQYWKFQVDSASGCGDIFDMYSDMAGTNQRSMVEFFWENSLQL